MTVHGSDYVTTHIDFAYRRTRKNAERIASALAPMNPRPEGWSPALPFVWDGSTIYNSSVLTLSTDSGSVDLLGEVAGIDSYADLEADATEVNLFGRLVKIASIDDLIKMKEAANRTKDKLHLLELRAIKANATSRFEPG